MGKSYKLAIHLRYMGNGASCDPTRRQNLTDDPNAVTCNSCIATKYYKKLKSQHIKERN